ncbi:MAG: universal stress protein [Desulfohalobiaceae bacterium]|nr:universal stress protein [Desulfohalobiaceae bacterium]
MKMELKKLLFVTQFEDLRFDTLQLFLELRRAHLEHIVFLNVIQRDKVALQRGVGYKKDEEVKLREMANIRFIDWAENLFEQGMEVGVYIVVGSLVQQVLSAVEKEGIDLVVIGSPEKKRFTPFISGSDISELIHRIQVPLMIINVPSEEKRLTENPFYRPLLAVDWTPGDTAAVGLLQRLKGVIQEVNVIHVAGEQDLKSSSAMGVQKTRKKHREKLEGICEQFEAAGLKARSHVYVGDPREEIERAARDCQASMIVSGIPEKRSWGEKIRKSLPVRLTEKTAFPVLFVPPALDKETG